MKKTILLMTMGIMSGLLSQGQADEISLYAAGSLKAALSDVAAAYEKAHASKVTTKFAPSGLLRQAIESGEAPDVFASANMKHPLTLAEQGWGGTVVQFAENKLCALAQPQIEISSESVLDLLLDNSIRVGTSTPKADPSGDYAWEVFKKAEQVKPGSFDILSGKALQLTGGENSEKAPAGKNQYGWVMSENKADIFLTYCTNAVLAKKQVYDLKIVNLPKELAVGANYGLIVGKEASVEAWKFAFYILSDSGQAILADYGFATSLTN